MSKLLYSHLIPRVNTSCDSDVIPFEPIFSEKSQKFKILEIYVRAIISERKASKD